MRKVIVNFNLTPELLDALDAHVEQRRSVGIETSRSAEARSLLRFALQHVTAQSEQSK
tara:strand:+ start:208 stop:381 length:174 start_codon:yes stop_codon:yes gene_type:complete